MAQTRQCPHGFHHPGVGYSIPHSCDGCWCEGEHDRDKFGWQNVDAHEVAHSRLYRRWKNVQCPECGRYGWRPGQMGPDDVEVPHESRLTA